MTLHFPSFFLYNEDTFRMITIKGGCMYVLFG